MSSALRPEARELEVLDLAEGRATNRSIDRAPRSQPGLCRQHHASNFREAWIERRLQNQPRGAVCRDHFRERGLRKQADSRPFWANRIEGSLLPSRR